VWYEDAFEPTDFAGDNEYAFDFETEQSENL
jgi:hypothetical protein